MFLIPAVSDSRLVSKLNPGGSTITFSSNKLIREDVAAHRGCATRTENYCHYVVTIIAFLHISLDLSPRKTLFNQINWFPFFRFELKTVELSS